MINLDAPKDRFHFVYAGMFLLGIGTSLPFNFFITAKDYFDYKLRNVTDPSKVTTLQSYYENYVSIASMIPNMIFALINTAIAHRVSQNKRIISSLIVTILIFCFTTVMVQIDSDSWQSLFFLLTMVSVVLISSACSLLSSGVFGLGNMLPPHYMQCVFSGQALGGIFTTLACICSLAVGSSSIDSATGYFSTAVAVLIFSFFIYVALTRTAFFQYYVTKNARSHAAAADDREHLICADYDDDEIITAVLPINSRSSISLFEVLKKCRLYAACGALVFFMTLAVFPAITSGVQSMHKDNGSVWTNKYFSPLSCFMMFNSADFASRLVASWSSWPRPGSVLLPIFCLLRLGFIPLLMLCNVQPRHHLPVIFDNDVYFIVLMFLMAFSNGYLGSLSILYGAKTASEHEQETAGTMMAFFLVVGLSLGAIFSFAVTAIV